MHLSYSVGLSQIKSYPNLLNLGYIIPGIQPDLKNLNLAHPHYILNV